MRRLTTLLGAGAFYLGLSSLYLLSLVGGDALFGRGSAVLVDMQATAIVGVLFAITLAAFELAAKKGQP